MVLKSMKEAHNGETMPNLDLEQPCQQIISSFKRTAEPREAMMAGMKALTESLKFNRSLICLIDSDHLRVVYEYEGRKGTASPKVLSPHATAELILKSMLGTENRLRELDNEQTIIAEWQPFFDLCGTDYASNVLVFLQVGGSVLGFLAIQSAHRYQLSIAEKALVSDTSNLIAVLLYLFKMVRELDHRATENVME